MALPTSGPLSFANIQTEFGGSNPISMNEYYAGGSYVPAGTSGTNGAVPSSGAISIYNFYGTSSFPFPLSYVTTTGSEGTGSSAFTFSSVSLGATAADRYTILCIGAIANSPYTATIGGLSCTSIVQVKNSAEDSQVGIFICDTSSLGTTANIVIDNSTYINRPGISIYRVTGLSFPTSYTTATDNTGNLSVSSSLVGPAFSVGIFFNKDSLPGAIVFTNFSSSSNDASYSASAGSAYRVASGNLSGSATVTMAATAPSFSAGAMASWFEPTFITATGGTITTVGDYKYHTFTGNGTFTVTSVGSGIPASNTIDYLVVAGGGSGGGHAAGGGGGAGGMRSVSGQVVSAQGYSVTIGAGGAQQTGQGSGFAGSNSVFSSITSTGGGYGAYAANGGSGGSGGGASSGEAGAKSGGSGTSGQGNSGGSVNSSTNGGGGGGGAGASGGSGTPTSPGAGGIGAVWNGTYYAGGGGAGRHMNAGSGAAGGTGGGGQGGDQSCATVGDGRPGTANTGGGGGGAGGVTNSCAKDSGAGGSGVVIIKYRYQ